MTVMDDIINSRIISILYYNFMGSKVFNNSQKAPILIIENRSS